jgi:chitinase
MTSPANGASFISPGTVVLKATATSSGSTIASVTYMDGPSKIAAVSAGPAYTYNWKTATAGSHTLTAIAKDKTGATTTSAAVVITVTADVAPVVTLTSPVDGFSTLGPVTINLAATACATNLIIGTL